MYYSKLKRLWEELNVLQPLPQCTRSVSNTFISVMSQNKLIQLFMGLNESYDSIRSQILVLDTMPSVSKASSMVLKVEKHRAIQMDLISGTESNTIMVKTTQNNTTEGSSNKMNQRKEDRVCEHCKATGHLKDTCFKIHGYSDCYKHLKKDKSAASGKNYVNMATNPFEEGDVEGRKDMAINWSPTMTEMIQQEIMKLLRGKQNTRGEQVNFAQLEDFVCNITSHCLLLSDYLKHWIIDTSVTNHICAVRNIFASLKPIPKKLPIHLPDGISKIVQSYGNI